MKSLWLPVALALCCSAFGGEPASIKFDSSTYRLASVSVGADGTVTNEYLKEGETLESWTSMLSIRHLPIAESINHAINPWLQSIRTQLAKKWSASKTPGSDNQTDVIIEAWLNTGTLNVEANLHRFVAEPGTAGVKSYRFVQRFDANDPGAKEAYAAKKYGRTEELGRLSVELVHEKS